MQQNQELESRVLHSTNLQKQLHLPQHLQQIKQRQRQQQQQQHPYLRRSLPPGLSPLGALSPVPPWLRPPLLEPEELAEEDKDVVVIEGGEEDNGPVILEGDIAVDREEVFKWAKLFFPADTCRIPEFNFHLQNYFRLGLRWDRYPQKKWTNNTVPYKISSEYRKGPKKTYFLWEMRIVCCRPSRVPPDRVCAQDLPVPELPPVRAMGRKEGGLPIHTPLKEAAGVSNKDK